MGVLNWAKRMSGRSTTHSDERGQKRNVGAQKKKVSRRSSRSYRTPDYVSNDPAMRELERQYSEAFCDP